ncbi:MAG TPA: cytochrome bc complex cytochrome b subunit [Candidatus Nanopelagicales bacterium]|jgi:ubiquinol-cytochrome c reductase cytochrome b subunit
MSLTTKVGGNVVDYVDQRTGIIGPVKANIRKLFPDHWSFMLGEIVLYSFIILLITGTYLTVFFKPSSLDVIYNGSYVPLKGVEVTEAYASTLNISFDVRGGLLIRQIHHWAALFFLAAMVVHMFRVFFTGAFRKPRELNWVIGASMTMIALLEGYAGYSLPDDLLSGVGVRIVAGIVEAIPVIGTYLMFFIWGGEYPGTDFIPRLFIVHVLLFPAILLAMVGAHLILVFYNKHTQYPGPGRTEDNVVGFPLFPVYTAKAGGFFFIVFGVTTLIASFVTINPIWAYGPYTPDQVSAGSQPDWYIGFLDGMLRAFPNWEWVVWGHTISWNILIPGIIMPGILFTALIIYPFLESWVTGDKREHHLLDRPRNAPVRTGIGVMAITFYGVAIINGANDIVAQAFGMSFNEVTLFTRYGLFILPPLAFLATHRACLGLQRRDREKLLHGRETGRILRLPHGEFIEVHEPLTDTEKAVILTKAQAVPLPAPSPTDENGVRTPHYRRLALQARWSRFWHGDQVERPTPAEIEAAEHHMGHSTEGGHADDGHVIVAAHGDHPSDDLRVHGIDPSDDPDSHH